MRRSSEILLVLAAGLLVGGTLGILFSPDKGSETRKVVKDKAKRLMKSLQGPSRREKLEIAKGKLEKYKSRIEKHLTKVNAKLQEQELTA